MIRSGCGCSCITGPCDEHKAQNALVSEIASLDISEQDEQILCTCSHPVLYHNEFGCMYPNPETSDLSFCPCKEATTEHDAHVTDVCERAV